MNIVFVVGGSYKAFYLNYLKKLKDVDLIVFQENILYEYDYYNETYGLKTVSNEMMNLASMFDCKVLAVVKSNLLGNIKKEILYADKDKVYLFDIANYLNLIIKNKLVSFAVGKNLNWGEVIIRIDLNKTFNKIKFHDRRKTYLYCNKSCVNLVKNGKIKRKFRKICYFCLRF